MMIMGLLYFCVVLLTVEFFWYAECRYAECQYGIFFVQNSLASVEFYYLNACWKLPENIPNFILLWVLFMAWNLNLEDLFSFSYRFAFIGSILKCFKKSRLGIFLSCCSNRGQVRTPDFGMTMQDPYFYKVFV